ncbi:MAG: DUF4258 domain-containing protein [Spirochaetales bacterium]|nr:DUF4258 domain-containing protein [Spirochaetales bacterium]
MILKLFITKHALQRLFERSISEEDIEYAINNGDIISEYPDDKPYPSVLVHCMVYNKPLHVVYSIDDNEQQEKNYVVITAYRPSVKEWDNDYMTRREIK